MNDRIIRIQEFSNGYAITFEEWNNSEQKWISIRQGLVYQDLSCLLDFLKEEFSFKRETNVN